jgi:hypothetical protein
MFPFHFVVDASFRVIQVGAGHPTVRPMQVILLSVPCSSFYCPCHAGHPTVPPML